MSDIAARPPGRPKDQEKRAAILVAATRAFLELGFERATMDAIAAWAGVSKLTVYNHFASKDALFRALVAHKCDEQFTPSQFESLASLGARAALTRIALGFVDLMFHPDVLALHRVLMANTSDDTSIHRAFYESGPAPTLDALAHLLAVFDAAGELRVAAPRAAADQFFALLKGEPHLRALLRLEPNPSAERLRGYAKAGVEMFLRAYAPM
jgi:TetR/AcrR family transcriptional repressor of mexJK operon